MFIQIPEDLVKNIDSDLVGLGWDLKICISNKLPYDAEATDPGITVGMSVKSRGQLIYPFIINFKIKHCNIALHNIC